MAEIKMDITPLTLKIYTKIAKWHNGEEEMPSKASLQVLSHEIVADIINFTLSEMDVKTKIGIEIDDTELNKKKKKWFWQK